MELETKFGLGAALVMILAAVVFYPDLTIAVWIAVTYLIVNTVYKLRKRRAKRP